MLKCGALDIGKRRSEVPTAWSSPAGLSNPDLSDRGVVRAKRSVPFRGNLEFHFVNRKLVLVTASSVNCGAAFQRVVEPNENALLSDIVVGRVACTRKSACLLLCPDFSAAVVFS